jgi:hypothetical protein
VWFTNGFTVAARSNRGDFTKFVAVGLHGVARRASAVLARHQPAVRVRRLTLRTEAAGRRYEKSRNDTVTANPFAKPFMPGLGKMTRPVANMASPATKEALYLEAVEQGR